jgi:peptidoglycan hydrolase-like protein with peptidoglycan-binding domain
MSQTSRHPVAVTKVSSVDAQVDSMAFSAQEIRQAQMRLRQVGLNPGLADGVLGPSTSVALERFQARAGLSITGDLNQPTWDALALAVVQPSENNPHEQYVLSGKKQLRDKPKKISEDDAKKMLKSQGFFDIRWNSTELVNKNYKDNENGTVTDLTTGLIWQKGGSLNALTWREAQSYIQSLNKEKYAGLSNWRVPTIEELASLVQKKNDGDLYLSPVFGNLQVCCWSSDFKDLNMHWISHFAHGLLYYNTTDKECFIKAVCSIH